MIADTFHLIPKKLAYVCVLIGTINNLYFIANTPYLIFDREFLYDDGFWRTNSNGLMGVSAYYDSEEEAKAFAINCGCEVVETIVDC